MEIENIGEIPQNKEKTDKMEPENLVKSSLAEHGTKSYYVSYTTLSEEAKSLIKSEVLLANADGPKKLVEKQLEVKAKTIEIKNYSFMNDGIWIKAIIDLEKYPALNDVLDEHIQCTFGEDSFHLEVANPNTGDKHVLDMPRTREKIVAERCKAYRRKTKIYVALYKQKEEDWWTLKGV